MKKTSKGKPKLHPRNKHHGRYDFQQLTKVCKELTPFVRMNPYNEASINFADPAAVKMLNRALLMQHYKVVRWDIPPNYLCPPIPGRADYIHHIADLLATSNNGKIPKGSAIRCLDIGVGANCIYPIIGQQEYGWSFIGTDIDPKALASAQQIMDWNSFLQGTLELRLQKNPKAIFSGVLQKKERMDVSICNPPFHASLAEAQAGTLRKLKNLNKKKVKEVRLNFGGRGHELWCEGGEQQFVREMIHQSTDFAQTCFWFSTLISKEANLKAVYRTLKKVAAKSVRTIPMGQGNKISRVVAWTFFSAAQQAAWQKSR